MQTEIKGENLKSCAKRGSSCSDRKSVASAWLCMRRKPGKTCDRTPYNLHYFCQALCERCYCKRRSWNTQAQFCALRAWSWPSRVAVQLFSWRGSRREGCFMIRCQKLIRLQPSSPSAERHHSCTTVPGSPVWW